MRVRTYVLVVAGTALLMSSGTKDAKPVVGVNPGDLAPGIESLGNTRGLGFQNHSGRYTLVNFWAAYDAESRARNVRLTNEVSKLGSERVALYSFSMDEKESVFAGTVKADKLDEATQFREELGKQSAVYKKFNRRGGFNNFLINDEGVIVATNVTPDRLAEVVKAI